MSWNYIAGFFDGEGWVSTCKNRSHPAAAIAQKTKKVLSEIQEFISYDGVNSSLLGPSHHGMYYLQINDKKSVFLFLSYLKNKTVVKKDKIDTEYIRMQSVFNRDVNEASMRIDAYNYYKINGWTKTFKKFKRSSSWLKRVRWDGIKGEL